MRRLVTERFPNVEFWYKSSVTGFEADETGRITAALVRKGGEDESGIVSVPCALLADCTGPALASKTACYSL
jgi:hypothetical protein